MGEGSSPQPPLPTTRQAGAVPSNRSIVQPTVVTAHGAHHASLPAPNPANTHLGTHLRFCCGDRNERGCHGRRGHSLRRRQGRNLEFRLSALVSRFRERAFILIEEAPRLLQAAECSNVLHPSSLQAPPSWLLHARAQPPGGCYRVVLASHSACWEHPRRRCAGGASVALPARAAAPPR